MLAVFVALLAACAAATGGRSVLEGQGEPELARGVVGFWHIGKGAKPGYANRAELVRKQLEELRAYPIFGKVNVKFMANKRVIDEGTIAALAAEPGFTPLAVPAIFERALEQGLSLFEFPTLYSLWGHCVENPTDTVFYFHSKTTDLQRTWYQGNMFSNPGAVLEELQRGKWIWTPTRCEHGPWCVSPGNFWWARCDHVARLNNPFDSNFLQEDSQFFDKPPKGRVRAEWWIVNDFLGHRPEHLSKSRNSTHIHPYQGSCEHPKHGDLCSHMTVAVRRGGVTRHEWARGSRPKIHPWNPLATEHDKL